MSILRVIDLRNTSAAHLDEALPQRSQADLTDAEPAAREIVEAVRDRGDAALVEYARRFDCASFAAGDIRVTQDEIDAAYEGVDAKWLDALRKAKANIEAFHRRQVTKSWTADFGHMRLGVRVTPLDVVGIYGPAGKAPLPSSVIMAGIPAKVAGVGRLVFCTPPQSDGRTAPMMLVAAAEVGADEMFKAGGAQAIAALAYGTETVPKCDKVVGPGNPYVVAAKRLVFGTVGIESLPGPSETCVIADAEANPAYVAADLLSQAEHGPDSPAMLVTDSEPLLEAVEAELEAQLAGLKRSEPARESLSSCGAAVLVRDLGEAADVANHLAPEHVQLMVAEAEALMERIRHAGCIFVGENSTVPLGDYVAGPSHVLPTNRTARFSSPLCVADFVKQSSVVQIDGEGLQQLADAAITLAEAEGLTGHARAVAIRRGER